jgi:hypothetical protein
VPDTRGLPPRYDQRPFDVAAAQRGFVLLASKDGRPGSIQVQQDVALWMTRVGAGERRDHALRSGRHAWLHVARGALRMDGHQLGEGDGAAFSEEAKIALEGVNGAEVLLFDLA